MRVLMLVCFAISVVALVVALMSFGRVQTAYDVADKSAEQSKSLQDDLDNRISGVGAQATNVAKAEAAAVKADLSLQVADLRSQLDALRADLTKLPTVIEVNNLISKSLSSVLEKLPQLDSVADGVAALVRKMQTLETQVTKLGTAAAGAADTELRAKVEALEAQFRKWMEVILPPEVIAQPQ